MRQRRRALDITQVELAQRVGCATTTIRKIELDERRPSLQLAERLAERLSIPEQEQDTFLRWARGEFVNLPGLTYRSPRQPAFLDASAVETTSQAVCCPRNRVRVALASVK